ncbi:hypothetical protein NT01EI_1079 [Edwardsiella ictaluri 93-146]|uniref:Uncharacterized protein n=1 Tax=Edwardsiella ictaluri (strain 93-146) TaxID=634503 RepID=C5BCJ8_EDWI9|nr:hypothetical protein NT01EI_1079 [Edwardsiella ictaluri 93-146]
MGIHLRDSTLSPAEKKWGMLSPILPHFPYRCRRSTRRATAVTVSYSPEACASG